MIPKSLLFLINLAASANDLWARDTEETRDKKEGGYLSGGGEDKAGKVTTQLAALKEESVASVALSLTFWVKPLSSLWTPVLFSIKQGPFQLAEQPGCLRDRQGIRGYIESCFSLLCAG